MDLAELTEFAKRYAEAWCSQDPEKVAAFFAEHGSLSVNDGPLAVGRAAIAEVARGFMRDLPDMVVTMDDVSRDSDGTKFHWTLVTGRHGETRSNQWLRNLEDRQWSRREPGDMDGKAREGWRAGRRVNQRRTHRRIERPLRCR